MPEENEVIETPVVEEEEIETPVVVNSGSGLTAEQIEDAVYRGHKRAMEEARANRENRIKEIRERKQAKRERENNERKSREAKKAWI